MSFQSLPNVIASMLTGPILPKFKHDAPNIDIGTPIDMESVNPSFVEEFTTQQTQASGRNTRKQAEQTPPNSILKVGPKGTDSGTPGDATPAATGKVRVTQTHSKPDAADPKLISETASSKPAEPFEIKDGPAAALTPDRSNQTTKDS